MCNVSLSSDVLTSCLLSDTRIPEVWTLPVCMLMYWFAMHLSQILMVNLVKCEQHTLIHNDFVIRNDRLTSVLLFCCDTDTRKCNVMARFVNSCWDLKCTTTAMAVTLLHYGVCIGLRDEAIDIHDRHAAAFHSLACSVTCMGSINTDIFFQSRNCRNNNSVNLYVCI